MVGENFTSLPDQQMVSRIRNSVAIGHSKSNWYNLCFKIFVFKILCPFVFNGLKLQKRSSETGSTLTRVWL